MNKFASGSALHDWREGLAVPIPDQEASLPTVGSAVPIAENVICYFRDNDDLDLAMTPRGIGALAGLLVTSTWTTVVDLQFELENRGMIIPMASLYPLLDRLVKIGLVLTKRRTRRKRPTEGIFLHHPHRAKRRIARRDTIAKSRKSSGGVVNE